MTNMEFCDEKGMSLAGAMNAFRASGAKSFEEWLAAERVEWKFIKGDFLRDHCSSSYLYVVIDTDDTYMYCRKIMRNGEFSRWLVCGRPVGKYAEDNTVFVFSPKDQHHVTRIF